MRGTSAASLDAVLQAARSNADAPARLGDELFGVVAVLDENPALRRVLTDPSVEPEAKARLAADVFGSSVSAATVAVVEAAVRGRWSAGRDLADALETAGVTAHVVGADGAGEIDRVQDELFAFARLVESDAELRATLTDRAYTAPAKRALVARLLQDAAHPAAAALAAQATVARAASWDKTLARFAALAAEQRSEFVAHVRVAAPLTDAERDRLAAALEAKYGRAVHLNVAVDPSVVGGVAVSLGDETIDGSISSRIAGARRQLAG